MVQLILLGAFITVVSMVTIIYGVVFSSRSNTISRLKAYTSEEFPHEEIVRVGLEDKKQDKIFLKVIGKLGWLMPKGGYFVKKKKKLVQAAVLMKPEEFLGGSIILGIIICGLSYLIIKSIAISVIFLGIGFIIPEVIIGVKKRKRKEMINAQLPQALDIIANGLRAGFSFIQAMGIVTEEVHGPISEEFGKVLRENILGKPLEEALNNMSQRIEDEDLDMVITTLIIQREVGGNLAEVLESIANTIRERVKLKGDIKSLTAQGRISGLVVSLLPFALALLLSIINPGYLNPLFQEPIGMVAIGLGLTLQIIGIFVLRKLMEIKV